MGAIQSRLLPNGTNWHKSCAAATGVDVFSMGTFPTKPEAKNMTMSRDCVNYLNQLNQQANSLIQCETLVGDQPIVLAELLTDLLMGKSSNKTKEVIGSSSTSGSVSLSASDSGSASASDAQSVSGSEDASASQQEEGRSAESGTSAGFSVTASLSVVAAVATTMGVIFPARQIAGEIRVGPYFTR
uniref:Elicitin n=1 Tax=Hyaloperonospora arabidopsidis (strain Emoy2) TaxID=559515 RepID=M4BPK6_HYAAE